MPRWAKVLLAIGCVLLAPIFISIVITLNVKKVSSSFDNEVAVEMILTKPPASEQFNKPSNPTATHHPIPTHHPELNSGPGLK